MYCIDIKTLPPSLALRSCEWPGRGRNVAVGFGDQRMRHWRQPNDAPRHTWTCFDSFGMLWQSLATKGNGFTGMFDLFWKNASLNDLSYLTFNMFQHSASNRVSHRIQPLEHSWGHGQSGRLQYCLAQEAIKQVHGSDVVFACVCDTWTLKYPEVSWSILKYPEVSWSILKYPEVSWSILKYLAEDCHTHRLQCGEKLFCRMCRLLLCICMSWSFSQLFVIWNSEARPATECHLSMSIPKVTRSDWIFNSCAWGWSEIPPMPKTVHFMCTCLARLDSI